MKKNKQRYNIAIVGATGLVGRMFLQVLEEIHFPVATLRLLASKRSAGKIIAAFGSEITVEALQKDSFTDIDVALFSAGKDVSLAYAKVAVQAGALVIDNSSAWRNEPDIPLVVPEVNPEDIGESGIIANPNCSTIQAVLPLKALANVFGIASVNYTTYQSVSGSGQTGIDELQATRNGLPPKHYPYNIAKTCIPQIDVFMENGYTKEEMKMVVETRKILHLPALPVSATCVRVPVEIGHGVNIVVSLQQTATLEEVRNVLKGFPGIVLVDDIRSQIYPVTTLAAGNDMVYVGRIRNDLRDHNTWIFYTAADNLRKGAASNAVGILLKFLERKHVL